MKQRKDPDFDPVQPRRWAVACKKSPAMTEHAVKPDEARTATIAVLMQVGLVLQQIREYDPRTDRFTVLAKDADGKLTDAIVQGETVARTVVAARTMSAMPKGLLRPSDVPMVTLH